MERTFTKPPQAIYNVLHEAESKGITLPKSVDRWWYIETIKKEEIKEKKKDK